MSLALRPTPRAALGAATAAALVMLSLTFATPAFADEAPPPEPVVETTTAATTDETTTETETETTTETEPVTVEVVAPESVDEVLDSTVEEPTLTLFAEEEAADDLVEILAVPAPGDPCYPAVCISNGTILLAVNPTGELNTDDGTGSPAGPDDAGLEYLPTGSDSTSPGCLCEGWGVADPATGTWGGANLDDLGEGGQNLTLESFEYTDSTATSVVVVNNAAAEPVFRVTHEYVPSPATPNLYQVNVTIENLTGDTIAVVQYRRVMDWDIEPTAFDEFVTMNPGSSPFLTFTSNDGFATSNPLAGPSDIGATGTFTDFGPDDHGALFDFTFGALAPGGKIGFVTFYGAAATEAEANAALGAVGAEAYSYGQTSTDPAGGTPNTFIFAFGNVGGASLFTPAGTPVAGAPAAAGSDGPALAATGSSIPVYALPGALVLLVGGIGALVIAAVRSRRASDRV